MSDGEVRVPIARTRDLPVLNGLCVSAQTRCHRRARRRRARHDARREWHHLVASTLTPPRLTTNPQVDFDPTLKKKKKKKVVLDVDSDGEAVEAVTGEMDDGLHARLREARGDGDAGDAAENGKKKKKKKKDEGDDDGDDDDENETGGGAATGSGLPWDGTSRDYHYDEMLGRVFGILREKNPALSEKTKTIIKPPQVLREGTKKTVFSNLMEICNAMHRNHDHVISYMMAELGTSGTLDGQQRLIIKGRFLPKVFEGVLRHYFIEYVICQMCKSSDTQLVKDTKTRLSNCVCQACGASRSVSAIQKGFMAVGRGDRRKARNAS